MLPDALDVCHDVRRCFSLLSAFGLVDSLFALALSVCVALCQEDDIPRTTGFDDPARGGIQWRRVLTRRSTAATTRVLAVC